MILSSRVEEALRAGDFRLAMRLIDQIMELPAELVATPGSRTYYPVWRQAVRLLRQLPPEGVQTYRQLHDAEIATRFEEAIGSADIDVLRDLFRRNPISALWPAIGEELVAQLLDRAGFAEAVELLREMQMAGIPDTPQRQAQRIVALRGIGAIESAREMASQLARDDAVRAQAGLAERVEQLRSWLAASDSEPSAAAPRATRFSPLLSGGAAWDQPLSPLGDAVYFDEDANIADAIALRRRLPLQQPILAGDLLLVRMRGTIWALDSLTMTLRWRVAEVTPEQVGLPAFAWPGQRLGRRDGGAERAVSADADMLLSEPLRHSISTGFGLVLSIESLQRPEADADVFRQRMFRVVGDLSPNELVARELETGRLVWRAGHEPSDPLHDSSFQDAPLPIGDWLVVPIAENGDVRLCALDPGTGRLARSTPIVGQPTFLPPEGGRCMLAADETTIYVCTGNGVIAALARDDFHWKWAAAYPSTMADHLGGGWPRPDWSGREWSVDRPVITADLLILAPVDSREIFALDRFSGQERWRIERGDHAALVGAVDAGLVAAGNHLVCLDLADGRTVRWRSVPMELTGRPAIRGSELFAPTRGGILVVDARDGRVIGDQWSPEHEDRPRVRDVCANLLVGGDALFSVAPGLVTKRPDPVALQARCDAILARDESDDRARLALGWLRLLERSYSAALALLETLRPGNERLAAARDRLLSNTFVALARDSLEGGAKLDWLRRAASLSLSADAAARLSALIGRTLEDAGRWPEALVHYRESLLHDRGVMVPQDADEELRVANWLHAAQRIRAGLSRVRPAEASAYLDSLIEAAAPLGDASVMARVRLVAVDRQKRAAIDLALSRLRLAPELAIEFITPDIDPDLPPPQRRAQLLDRWETHVALGMLDDAVADRDRWRELNEDDEAEPADEAAGEDDGEARRAARIDRAHRKLEQSAETSFDLDFRKQWRLSEAELIVDPHAPTDSMRRALLVRDLRNRKVALCMSRSGEQIRDTLDAVQHGPAFDAVKQDATSDAFFAPAGGFDDPAQLFWAATTRGALAVVPVRGGLICLGVGPGGGLGAGRRLWEHELPEWGEIPGDFARRSAAGPEGVYVATRDSRIVLLSWFDGQTRWQRDLPGMSIARLAIAGDRLVVIGDGQQVTTLDAAFGDQVLRLPPASHTPRAIELAADMLVVWTDDSIAGLDPATLEPHWSQPTDGVAQATTIAAKGWVAYRARDGGSWRVLDARTGSRAIQRDLNELDDVVALTVEGGRLFAVSRPSVEQDSEHRAKQQLAAFDLPSGALSWSRVVESAIEIHAGQLSAHSRFIPVLLLRRPEGADGAPDLNALAIQLIDKSSGTPSPPEVIGKQFDPRKAWCGVYMLATPTRMIVQAAGNIVAYGNSALSRGP